MSSSYKAPQYWTKSGDTLTPLNNEETTVSVSSIEVETKPTFNDMTLVDSVTSTGQFMTVTINGSALAIELLKF